jgi:nucleoside-diphosphate-sugar epimerase
MRVLFVGGTGNISSACVELALERGWQVSIATRGLQPSPYGDRVDWKKGDRSEPAFLQGLARQGRFDVVCEFIGFTPADIETDLKAFSGQVGQYVFISSATVYQKPPRHYLIREDAPLENPFWEYARQKIACENLLMKAHRESSFPVTIVRPSYTFGPTWIPAGVGGPGYTFVYRMRKGLPVISHGDGQSLWTMTFHTDFAQAFVGLFGAASAVGEAFHITSDEVLTWDQIYQTMGRAAGVEPAIIHLPSEVIARKRPEWGPSLMGDKRFSGVFDNAKIKRVVPGFQSRVSFAEGIARSIAWHDADPTRRQPNLEANRAMDELVDLHRQLMG